MTCCVWLLHYRHHNKPLNVFMFEVFLSLNTCVRCKKWFSPVFSLVCHGNGFHFVQNKTHLLFMINTRGQRVKKNKFSSNLHINMRVWWGRRVDSASHLNILPSRLLTCPEWNISLVSSFTGISPFMATMDFQPPFCCSGGWGRRSLHPASLEAGWRLTLCQTDCIESTTGWSTSHTSSELSARPEGLAFLSCSPSSGISLYIWYSYTKYVAFQFYQQALNNYSNCAIDQAFQQRCEKAWGHVTHIRRQIEE